MSVNLGHSIQKIIHNTPIRISVNDTTSSVVTSGGAVFQSGLISNKIQYSFQQVLGNENIVGNVIDVQSTDNVVYFLNDAGSVFSYDYNSGECSPVVREVYSPEICGGDPAVRIRSGENHLVILTKRHRVFGVGDNSEYQLVPQGQCYYDVAVELIITDTNVHDNFNCCAFMGTLNELNKPCIPKKHNCGQVSCIKNNLECVKLGELALCNVKYIEHPGVQEITGTLYVPVYGDISYVGFLCVGDHCELDGNITYTVEKACLKKGCQKAKFIQNNTKIVKKIPISLNDKICFECTPFTEVVQVTHDRDESSSSSSSSSEESSDESSSSSSSCEEKEKCCNQRKVKCCDKKKIYKKKCHSGKRDNYKCGDTFKFKINTCKLGKIHVYTTECGLIISQEGIHCDKCDESSCSSSSSSSEEEINTKLVALKGTLRVDCREPSLLEAELEPAARPPVCKGRFKLEHKIKLDCCVPCKVEEPKLPQPCWMSVYAGFNTTVLVDSCNRMYVLGSIHDVRNNANLLKRSCLEDLLCNTDASISLPANQLNCGVSTNNTNCLCPKSDCKKPFRTDLSKFGINLRFPTPNGDDSSDDCDCCPKTNNVCDFLKALKQCNEAPYCNNTCEPCDPNIYLNVFESCEKNGPVINSITILNKKSVCKIVSQGQADIVKICLTPDTIIEFDLNHYCIDAEDFPLYKTLVLSTGAKKTHPDAVDITLYIDLDNPGSIMFVPPCKSSIVEFVVDASNESQQFIMNYGDVMDPVELTNLKSVLINSCAFPCPQFKNPFCTKLFNTYLKGGDCVNFYKKHRSGIKLAVTADVPTVFKLNRKVLDIGVGDNNLSVLVGSLACPNEIFAIGQNCYGELGLDSFESTVCWKQVNRCLFDCQVSAIYTGPHVTMYVTQSGRVFGSGLWKCLVNSTVPVCIPTICQAWKTKQIAISKNQILILSNDSCLYGVGDNSLGELGLCHINCVPVPTPIEFFAALSHRSIGQLFSQKNYGNYKQLKYDKNNCEIACDTPYCKPFYKSCEPCKVDCGSCCEECAKKNKSGNRNNANQRITARRNNGRW